MVAGTVRIELYSFVPGSANCKGARLEVWNIELLTETHQRRYWNRLTQMYEFRLGADLTAIPRAPKYVLLVTYSSPFGDRLTDELVLGNRQASPLDR